MSITKTSTVTKPSDKLWWNEVDPDAFARLKQYIIDYPGMDAYTPEPPTDPNVRVSILVFQDQDAVNRYLPYIENNADYIAFKSYANENNFIINTVTT